MHGCNENITRTTKKNAKQEKKAKQTPSYHKGKVIRFWMSNLIRWKSQKDTKTRGKVELHYVSAQTYKKTKKDNTNNNTFYETLALSLIHYAPGTHSLMFCAAYHRPQQLPRKIHPLCDPHLSHPRTPITVTMLPIRKRIPNPTITTHNKLYSK